MGRGDDELDSFPADLSGAAPAVERDAASTTDAFAPPDGARYDAVARLGEGGMGRVALVFDRLLRRQVALKRPRLASPAAAARLAQEASITAQLEHPNIVAVHDAGRDAEGAFYTMRLVRGRSLEDVLANAPLPQRLATLRPFLAACEAVAFAHSVGVVHRDLKPHNIMVGEFGETQVVDWGVARPVTSQDDASWRAVLPEGPAETIAGEVVGTPAYMAPEQTMVGRSIDQRADVWSLGAVLYRIVSGAAPFAGSGVAVLEARRAGLSPADLASVTPAAPRELVAIAARAMAADPAGRYPDAKALAIDVEAYLDGRRVDAHDYSAWELLRRLGHAWRVPLAVAAVALVALVVVGAVATTNVVAERNRAVEAERQSSAALASMLLTESAREAALGARPESELLAARALTLGAGPAARGALMAWDSAPRPQAGAVVALPAGPRVVNDDGSAFVTLGAALTYTETQGARVRWRAEIAGRSAAFFGDGRVAVGDAEDRIWVLDAGDGRVLEGPLDLGPVERLVGGRQLVALRGWAMTRLSANPQPEPVCVRPQTAVGVALGARREVVLCDDEVRWRPVGGAWAALVVEPPASEGAAGPPEAPHSTALALSPDEARLALADERGHLTVVDLPAGRVTGRWDTGHRGLRALDWSPDGAHLAVVSVQDGVRVVAAGSGAEVARLPRAYGLAARWADAGTLVTFGAEAAVTWTLPKLSAPAVPRGAGVASVAVGPDGSVAVARGDGVVDVLGKTGEPPRRLEFGDRVIKRVAFSLDGRSLWVAAMARPGATRVDTATWREVGRFGEAALRRLAPLRDGGLVVAPWDTPFAVYDSAGVRRAAVSGEPEAVDLDEDPAGSWVALLEDGTGRVFGTEGGAPWLIGTWPGAVAVSAGPDDVVVGISGWLVRAGKRGGELARWPLGTASATQDVERGAGGLVAVSALDGTTRIFGPDGALMALLGGHEERVAALVFDEGGLWTGSWDGSARRWGLAPLHADPASALGSLERAWATRADSLGVGTVSPRAP
ncbi:MAG: serine/threonine-protein kinase [Myxococcota bacterium]